MNSDFLTQEELQSFLERESVSDFLLPVECIVKEDIHFYTLQNGFRGFAFEVHPGAYAGSQEFDNILNIFSKELPPGSAIQILHAPSKNVDNILEMYKNGHQDVGKINSPESIKFLIDENCEWIKDARDSSLFGKGKQKFISRIFNNVISIMIPEYDKNGHFIIDKRVLEYAIAIRSSLSNLSPISLSADRYSSIISEILNPASSNGWNTEVNDCIPINKQIIPSSTEYNLEDSPEFIKIKSQRDGDYYYTVLTNHTFPRSLTIDAAQSLFMDTSGISEKEFFHYPYSICLNISIEDKEEAKDAAIMVANANQFQMNNVGPMLKKFNPELEHIAAENEQLVQLLTVQNESILKSQWTLMMGAPSEYELKNNIDSVLTQFENFGWKLQQETEIPFMFMLYSLPFQFDERFKKYAKTFSTTLKNNNACLAPLYSDSRGTGHPATSYLTHDRNGGLQFFDNFDPSVPGNNIVIAAPSRSGKSFFINGYFSASLAVGRKIVFVELHDTMSDYANAIGEEYYSFNENTRISLNFFTDAKIGANDKELHPDALYTIIPLVGLMMNKKLMSATEDIGNTENAVLSAYIEGAVKATFSIKGRESTMEDVYHELGLMDKQNFKNHKEGEGLTDRRLTDALKSLEPFCIEGGSYYHFFNSKKTISFEGNSFTGIGLAGLEGKGNLTSIVLLALSQAVVNDFYNPEIAHIQKIFTVDEAWSVLDNPIMAAFMNKVWRTVNKYNGCGIAISQDIDQYFQENNPELSALYTNSPYKIFFRHSDPNIIDRHAEKKYINTNPLFLHQFKSLKRKGTLYSEFIVDTELGFYVGRVIANKYEFNLYSNRDGSPEVYQLMKEFEFSKPQASWVLNFLWKHSCELEVAIEALAIIEGDIQEKYASKEYKNLFIKNIKKQEDEVQIEVEEVIGLTNKISKYLKKVYNKYVS